MMPLDKVYNSGNDLIKVLIPTYLNDAFGRLE